MEERLLGLLAHPSPPSRWRLRDERPLSSASPVCPRGSGRSGAGAVWGHPWATRRRFEGTSHPPLVRWISWKRSPSYPVRLSVVVPPHAWFFCRSWSGFSSSNSMGGVLMWISPRPGRTSSDEASTPPPEPPRSTVIPDAEPARSSPRKRAEAVRLPWRMSGGEG